MARVEAIQLSIRSRFARGRADLLARQTGMTKTQIVEEALRAYVPPPTGQVQTGLIRKGRNLVKPAEGKRVTYEQAEAALDESRGERG